MSGNAARVARRAIFALAAVALVPAGTARAGFVITDFTQQPSGDPFETYTLDIVSDGTSVIKAGDYITLVDLFLKDTAGEFFDSAAAPPGWTTTTSLLGLSPVPIPDREDMFNVVWIYGGPNLVGPQPIGSFVVTVHVNEPPPSDRIYYIASNQKIGLANPTGNSIGLRPLFVPEPASLSLLGLGMLWLGLRGFRRARGPATR